MLAFFCILIRCNIRFITFVLVMLSGHFDENGTIFLLYNSVCELTSVEHCGDFHQENLTALAWMPEVR